MVDDVSLRVDKRDFACLAKLNILKDARDLIQIQIEKGLFDLFLAA